MCIVIKDVPDFLVGVQSAWAQVQPYAGPAVTQVQNILQPVWAALEPHVGDNIEQVNQQLHGHPPLTVIGITIGITFLLLRLLGAAKRVTGLLLAGTALAYFWPYAMEQLKKMK